MKFTEQSHKKRFTLLFDHKIGLLHEKLSFKLPTIMQFRAQTKQDQKIICPSSSTTVHNFSELRSYGPEVEGRDLGTL